jgi:hypothetical protein
MRPAENIERLIENAQININQEVKRDALAELVNELESSKIGSPTETMPNIWRIIMKSKITKFAAAAAVIIVAVFIVMHFLGGFFDPKLKLYFRYYNNRRSR